MSRLFVMLASMLVIPAVGAFDTEHDSRALLYFEVPFGKAAAAPSYSFGVRLERVNHQEKMVVSMTRPVRAAPVMDIRGTLEGISSWTINGEELLANRYVTSAAEGGSKTVVITIVVVAAVVGAALLIVDAVEDEIEESIDFSNN